jgi:hypothetical protein
MAGSAQSYIVLSAFVVAALYSWRWLTGNHRGAKLTPATLVAYNAPLVSPEGFVVAWGVIYLTLAIVGSFAPGLAGAMALLILTGDVLANGVSVAEGTTALEAAKTETVKQSKGKRERRS